MVMNLQTTSTGAAYPANVGLRHRKHRNLSASQLLWAKLERTAARVELVRALSRTSDPAELAILAQCTERLELARERIDRTVRQTWAFWEVIHRVDELLLLVMPAGMLRAEATDVLAKFEDKIKDAAVRKVWLGADGASGPLPQVVERLAPGAPPLQPGDRHVLRNALNLVNEQGDTNFWRLGSNVSVQALSALLLLVLFVFAVFVRPLFQAFPSAPPGAVGVLTTRPDTFDVLLLGAAGAILANLIATKPIIVSIGPTSRYYAHNLFVKPVIGAFAAGLVTLLVQSGLTFGVSTTEGESGAGGLVLDPAHQVFLRSILAVAAGFAAEWMLRPMMENVLRAISLRSEKVATGAASERK